MDQTKKTAHVAGAIYLSMGLLGPLSLIYIPDKLIVRGDAAATATNVLSHAGLFRLWVISDLWMPIIFIALGLALYQLLASVSRIWARTMVALVLVSATVGFFNTINTIAAFILFRGTDFLRVFDQAQRDALGMLFLRLHSHGNFMNEIFWGLWLFPFGLLVFRSGFLPRVIGAWLMLDCFAWLVLSPLGLFWPGYYDRAFAFAQPFLFAELAIMLWLLIKGVKVSPTPVLTSTAHIVYEA